MEAKILHCSDLFSQHDLPEIYSWFEDLAAAHPQYLTVNSSIGKTYHNTDIMAVHFTDKSDPQRKIKVYFQCLLHARKSSKTISRVYTMLCDRWNLKLKIIHLKPFQL